MSYPQFGYPYSSAPQVSWRDYYFVEFMGCFGFWYRSDWLSHRFKARCFYALWHKNQGEAHARWALGYRKGFALQPVIPALLQRQKKKGKRGETRNQRETPRPPVHWFLQDNSRSVMSTICLFALEHTCQLVQHTLCVCVCVCFCAITQLLFGFVGSEP